MSTTDELGPYSKWLVAVAAAAKLRPWRHTRESDRRPQHLIAYCVECGKTDDYGVLEHASDCLFAALDAALDAEPKE